MKNRSPLLVRAGRSVLGGLWVVVCLVDCAGALRAQQSLPKTADIDFAVAADGSMNMGFKMTFDAANWRAWKATIGDEPARMRAMMRHQFAAMTLEDFKLERDDINRAANMTMRSPSGPELRDDGTYQMPVDGYFRLVNHNGREWFFSGNNPNAGGTLNNVKVTLPATVTEARVINADNPDQALLFALAAPPSASRWFYLAGGLVTLLGMALLAAGLLLRQRRPLALPVAPVTPLLPVANVPGTAATAAPAARVVPPSSSSLSQPTAQRSSFPSDQAGNEPD